MNDKLKPCPFCGGEAVLMQGYYYGIECKSCFSRTDLYSDTKSAVEAWNNRTSTWKPIETAPKDGTAILTWKHGWREVEKCRYIPPLKTGSYESAGYWELVHAFSEEHPTHWMPLPEPPEDEK